LGGFFAYQRLQAVDVLDGDGVEGVELQRGPVGAQSVVELPQLGVRLAQPVMSLFVDPIALGHLLVDRERLLPFAIEGGVDRLFDEFCPCLHPLGDIGQVRTSGGKRGPEQGQV
jgi:hypothetical protein